MRRGEVWTLRDGGYASKARPVVVVQDESVAEFDSIILCLLTSYDSDGMPTRVKIGPSDDNGLFKTSYVMADKIISVDKALLGERIGVLADEDMELVGRSLAKILGLG